MSNTLRTLSNIRSLRVLARETSLEQLESLLEKDIDWEKYYYDQETQW